MLLLLVDDDADDRDIFCESLELIDASVTCVRAKNGVECLSTLLTMPAPPDYIFLDLNMPLMDGFTCLKEIRKRKAFNDVRIIMYSTTIGPNEQRRCASFGANGFLVKPPNFGELSGTLRSLFSEQSALESKED